MVRHRDLTPACGQMLLVGSNPTGCVLQKIRREGLQILQNKKSEFITKAQKAVQIEVERLKLIGVPIFYCNPETMTIIKENSDGTKIDTGYKVKRYSEKSKK